MSGQGKGIVSYIPIFVAEEDTSTKSPSIIFPAKQHIITGHEKPHMFIWPLNMFAKQTSYKSS